MGDSFDLALEEFLQELESIKNLVILIDTLRAFGSVQVPELLAETSEFSAKAIEIHERERSLSTQMPILSGTLLLYLVGRFESFVRHVFEVLCDSIAEKCIQFDELPENMRKYLIVQTAEVMTNSSRYGYDDIGIQVLVENLSSNMRASTGLGAINSQCLSITTQNMRNQVLSDLFKRVGINSLWDEVGKQTKLKTFFQNMNDKEVTRDARTLLDEIMAARNQVAHPEAIPTIPDVLQVQRYIEFLASLSFVLTDICRVHLVAHNPIRKQ